jgi:sulfate permease, SulP family
LPEFMWPWNQPGVDNKPLQWDLAAIEALLPAAFSIAMLGAIESLLCAVVLDGMTGKRHSANSELLGQGIGNIVAPFFGGITATAAIARSAANVKAGAQSPVAAMIHALVVLAALVLLAPLLAYLPMPSMAALLLVVAWNMSEAHKALGVLKTSPRGDIAVLLTCLALTVLFDMVIAITSGILLAAVLFMRDIAQMTKIIDISTDRQWVPTPLPPRWRVLRIKGPLFFAAADRVFGELGALADGNDGLVIHLEAVSLLDGGGLAAMQKFIAKCHKGNTRVIFAELQFQPLKTLRKADVQPQPHSIEFAPTLSAALLRVCADRHANGAADATAVATVS